MTSKATRRYLKKYNIKLTSTYRLTHLVYHMLKEPRDEIFFPRIRCWLKMQRPLCCFIFNWHIWEDLEYVVKQTDEDGNIYHKPRELSPEQSVVLGTIESYRKTLKYCGAKFSKVGYAKCPACAMKAHNGLTQLYDAALQENSE